MQRRLDHLALNPRENDVSHEANARPRTIRRADRSTSNLPAARRKWNETGARSWKPTRESPAKRIAADLGRVFTRGPRVDPEKPDPILHAQLDAYRRSAYHERFLDELLASSPSPDVVWDAAAIRRSVSAITSDTNATPKAQRLVSQVCARSTDGDLRLTCLRAREHWNVPVLAGSDAPPMQPIATLRLWLRIWSMMRRYVARAHWPHAGAPVLPYSPPRSRLR